MSRHIIVDGYNFLFAIGRKPHQADRLYLLNLLAAYQSRKHVQITVVFDRKTGDPAEGRQLFLHQGIKVVFSAPAQEADEIIRQIVESAEHPRDCFVVSSDRAGISIYCRKLGAAVIGSKEFYTFLKKSSGSAPRDQRASDEEEKPQATQKDIEYYLEKFSKKKKE